MVNAKVVLSQAVAAEQRTEHQQLLGVNAKLGEAAPQTAYVRSSAGNALLGLTSSRRPRPRHQRGAYFCFVVVCACVSCVCLCLTFLLLR